MAKTAIDILKDVDGVSITEFGPEDVQRAKIVKKVIQAFNSYEKRNS